MARDPSGYRRQGRQEVLGLIPETARTVLEVGCGAGLFGAALKARQGAEVWGVEPDATSAEEARTRLDHVVTDGIEAALPRLPTRHFDLVICNDVLEHLVDPGTVLATLRGTLAPGGMLSASIPNLRYSPALKKIVSRADFPYADSGVFDRTHLRFFTRRSMHRLFEEAGYQVVKQTGINPTNQFGFTVWNTLLFGRLSDCRYLQYVTLARPA